MASQLKNASAGIWLCKRVLSKKPQDQPMMMKLLQLQFTAQVCKEYNCGNNLPQETIAITTWLAVLFRGQDHSAGRR